MPPPRPILRIGWAVHRAVFAATGGRVETTRPGRRVGTLFLLARGRRTGKVRRNGLFYVEDGSAFAVVASNAGEDAAPKWWLNLRTNPDADVEVGRQRIAVRASRGDRRRGGAPLAAARRRVPGVGGLPAEGDPTGRS